MSRKYVGFILAGFAFVFFLLFSLYEGSNLIDDPFEWARSTPFTHLLVSNPVFPQDIFWLDFFVYAIKFYAVYPIMTLISAALLLGLIIRNMNKNKKVYINISGIFLGVITLYTSLAFFSAHSLGSIVFRYSLLIIGLMLVLCASYSIFRHKTSN
ncbi:hypothetical protein CHI12_16350 [Terribacillus saccharophilus]|jgi:hypothetical protein|uniref:DUF4306 domain-containing protein n=1 Tax=Terribacillus saccharophilus TaxID=361277 RepID=A0A268H9D7_9BACI|nr:MULTISPECIES: DUF4306 domain-containing protein [Terribacillus]PAE06479.1 hypothetical protein CHI12_16350 [Terribacillus saccharophilus]